MKNIKNRKFNNLVCLLVLATSFSFKITQTAVFPGQAFAGAQPINFFPAAQAINQGYVPTQGPLRLEDVYVNNQWYPMGAMIIKRGRIMEIILQDNSFEPERRDLYRFTRLLNTQTLPTYQNIVDSLLVSTDTALSIAVIEAFEKAIMTILHYEHYVYYSHGSWSNMFVTGIRKDWVNPYAWMNLSTWSPSYVSADITQLMHELKQLARVAMRHSVALSIRLNATADSYLYWKTRTLKTLMGAGILGALYYNKEAVKEFSASAAITGNNFLNYLASFSK